MTHSTLDSHTTQALFNDLLLTTNGENGGADIIFERPPSEDVPAMLFLGAGLTALLLMGIAWLRFRRHAQARTTVATLMLVASIAATAWAAPIALDGNIADWAGIPPLASDITNDSTNDDDAEDIVAAFVTADGANLFFRLDVVNLAPVVCGNGNIEYGEDCEEDLVHRRPDRVCPTSLHRLLKNIPDILRRATNEPPVQSTR